jgi:hypothetical protein
MLIFMPWLFLNISLILIWIFSKIFKEEKGKTILFTFTVTLILCLTLIFSIMHPKIIVKLLHDIFLKTPLTFLIMLIILISGLVITKSMKEM